MKHFIRYAAENLDDSPLMLCEDFFNFNDADISTIPTDHVTSAWIARLMTDNALEVLSRDYSVPKYFTEDFLNLLAPSSPLFRSFMFCPERSGIIFDFVEVYI